MATQADIDALTEKVTAAAQQQQKGIGEVKAEIEKLQAAGVDVTGLSSAVDTLVSGVQELDDLNPDVPETNPEPTPEPEPTPAPTDGSETF